MFALAEAPFVAGTTIVAADVNSDLDDIADGLTLCLTNDGQSIMTAPIKGFAGTVSLPGYTFSNDLDSGMYRIGSNNIGLAVGGTKILDIASTGLTVTGAFSATTTITAGTGLTVTAGGLTITAGVLTAPVGAVGAPSYTFAADTDSGFYHIGANNIGAAVNGAKVLDIATAGLAVTGSLSATTSVTAGNGLTVTTGAVSLPAGSVADAALAVKAGRVLISAQAASSSATIDFTGLDDTYDHYQLVISSAKPATDDVEMWIRIGTGAGPTYQAGAGAYYWQTLALRAGVAGVVASTGDTKIIACFTTATASVGNAAGENYVLTIDFNNPEATDFMEIYYQGNYVDSTGIPISITGGGHFSTAGAVTAIRLMFESGNIASGRFALYGYRKS